MCTFIDDYLLNPSRAVANARLKVSDKFSGHDFSEDEIYKELDSPEFRLYEEIIFTEDIGPQARGFAVA